MAIDYITLNNLLAYLKDTIEEIKQLNVDEEVLEGNKERAAATKYYVQTAVECCANIAEHIVFGLHLGNPETTKELFPILGKQKIIDQDLAEKLTQAVGLRNILVHQYRDVDLHILANAATTDLDDLREFAKAINDFLEKNPDI